MILPSVRTRILILFIRIHPSNTYLCILTCGGVSNRSLKKEEETDWTHILWWKHQIICYKSLYTMNCEEFKVYWNVSSAPSHWRTNNISSSQWLESCSVRLFFFSSSPWWNSPKSFFPQDPHLQCQANLTKEMFSKGRIILLLPLDCERLPSPWQLCFAHSWAAQVWPWGGRMVSLFLQE